MISAFEKRPSTWRSWPRAWAPRLRRPLPRLLLFSAAVLTGLLPGTPAAEAQEAPPSGEIRDHLRDILSSGEYDTTETTTLSQTFWEWLVEKLNRFFSGLSGLSETAPVLFWLILIVLVAILLAIFAHGGYIVARALKSARAAAPPEERGGPGAAERPEELLARAREAASRRRYAEAVGLSLRAAILGLDRRGLVRYQDCLTLGDYRRQLRKHPRALSTFEILARVYEPATFGRMSVGGDECSACMTSAGTLVRGQPS